MLPRSCSRTCKRCAFCRLTKSTKTLPAQSSTRRLIVDVLQLPGWLCELGGPMDLLRRKLAHEPQIHGGKKSRVVFSEKTDDSGKTVFEERLVKRHDRGSL